MNLRTKKELAAKTLKVGKKRIVFVSSRREEIKEAITKQDIRDLVKDGAILVRLVGGRKKVEKRKKSRGPGKVRKKVNKRKKEYVKLTRKLRNYIHVVKASLGIEAEEVKEIRKQIRNKRFKSLANLKDHVGGTKK